VLLADRHHGLSEGVHRLLETEFDVVVMVADEASLVEAARRLCPTLAVTDLSLARSQSLVWISNLRLDHPELKVIVLSVHDEPSACRSTIAAGVNGYVLKRDIAAELLPAVTTALAGGTYISAGVLARLSPTEQRMHRAAAK
jgi:DNA-binding NarL/FixJ family response regulator